MDWRAGMGEAALAALDAPIEPPTRSEEWSAEPAGRLGSAVEIDRVRVRWRPGALHREQGRLAVLDREPGDARGL